MSEYQLVKQWVRKDGTVNITVYNQKKYVKKYYENNKDKVLENVRCECGLVYGRSNKWRHYNTRLHKLQMKRKDVIIL